MNSPNHYRTMTDEQLALWHQQAERLRKAERSAEIATASAEQLQAAHEKDREQLLIELATRANIILDLTMKHGDQLSANRRLCGQQVVLVQALRTLVDTIHSPAVLMHQSQWPGEVFRAIEQAAEVLALVEIPF